ncbi:MAG: VCBS repeat-containing protein [Candidatus Moranbacteria bacterium]|jgi:hypothetical protein|nr:VCBS repeat-containing protein [Candidatus Moranbacteria bacterium]
MKKSIVILILGSLFVCESAFGTMKSFSWSKNPELEVLGYNLYVGSSSRNYGQPIDVGNITTWTLDLSDSEPSFLAITAYNSEKESEYSAEIIIVPEGFDNVIKTFHADLNNDGWQDTLYLRPAGLFGRMASGSDGFIGEEFLITGAFSSSNGWDISKHIILVKDLNKDGFPDIIGFGSSGVIAAHSIDGRTFESAKYLLKAFGYNDGWRVDAHPRGFEDINKDGYPDIYGFGSSGVIAAHSIDGRTFESARYLIKAFGYDAGWRVGAHPRGFEDINNDGYPDIYGFGSSGVIAAHSIDGRTFESARYLIKAFGYDAGWRVGAHPRGFEDINNDGYPDIYGFGSSGVIVAYSIDGRSFENAGYIVRFFGYDGGWVIDESRNFVTIDDDGLPEVIGWKTSGEVMVSYSVNPYYFTDPVSW